MGEPNGLACGACGGRNRCTCCASCEDYEDQLEMAREERADALRQVYAYHQGDAQALGVEPCRCAKFCRPAVEEGLVTG